MGEAFVVDPVFAGRPGLTSPPEAGAGAAGRRLPHHVRAGLETSEGRIRARDRLNENLEPGVVCGQRRWRHTCPGIEVPGDDPSGAHGATANLPIGPAPIDPISGSVRLNADLCETRRVD